MSELINAIEQKNTTNALQLIHDGCDIGYFDAYGSTILMIACYSKMPEVALALIATGNAKLDHVNVYGNTALIYACDRKLLDVALALIANGNAKPEHVNNNHETAIIYACMNNMPKVAMALIATGKSNAKYINNFGCAALILAKHNKMIDVIDAIENYDVHMSQINKSIQLNPFDDPNYVMEIII